LKWTKKELDILTWKSPLSPDVWMEKYYYLDGSAIAEKGPYRFRRSQFFKEIAQQFESTEEIVIRKSAQCGYSIFFTGILSYCLDNYASDALLVFPSQQAGADFLHEKVYPSFKAQEWMKPILPANDKDYTSSGIKCAGSSIHLAFSGSPTSLASRSVRFIFADEVSKFQGGTKEADPISLMRERQVTYGTRARTIYGCTPTNDRDEICQLFDNSGERYYFHIPCNICNRFFFPETKLIKWDIPHFETNNEKINYITDNKDLVYMECPHCQSKITEAGRCQIILEGKWLAENEYQDSDLTIKGPNNKTARRKAYQINRLMSPYGCLWRAAIEFIGSLDSPHKLKNYANSWEGLPYKESSREYSSSEITNLCPQQGKKKSLINMQGYLVASADTQATHYHWSVYQISEDHIHLVDYGQCQDRDSLITAVFGDYDGKKAQICAIDARGNKTQDIYHFVSQTPNMVAVLGANSQYFPPFKKSSNGYNAISYSIDTVFYKDKLFDAIEKEKISTFENIDRYWAESITAERKEAVKVGSKIKYKYVEIKKDKNHQLDCLVYSMFAYDYLVATTGNSSYQAPKPKLVLPPHQLFKNPSRRF